MKNKNEYDERNTPPERVSLEEFIELVNELDDDDFEKPFLLAVIDGLDSTLELLHNLYEMKAPKSFIDKVENVIKKKTQHGVW